MAEEKKTEVNAAGFVDSYAIQKFTGDDTTYSSAKWAQDIEDNAEVFGWSAHQKLIVARRSLAGTAELWMRTEKVLKTYEELRSAIQKEFPDTLNAKEMHELMSTRKKRRDESCYQYMLVMKELGKKARFPDYVSIQYIIDGIMDSAVNKTILYGATTYPVLKEKLGIYDMMKEASRSQTRESNVPKKPFVKSPVNTTVRRCFNCGGINHVASSCPYGIKCFRCNQFGHIGQRCTEGGGSGGAGRPRITSDNQQAGGSGTKPGAQAKQMYTSAATTETPEAYEALDAAGLGTSTTNGNDLSDGHVKISKMEEKCQTTPVTVTKEVMSNVNKSTKSTKSVIIAGYDVITLIDSGSDVNLVSEGFYRKLGLPKFDDDMIFSGLGSSTVRSRGYFHVNISIDEQCYNEVTFHVVPRDCMPFDLILGQEFLSKVVMVMREGSVTLLSDRGDDWMSYVNCVSELDVTDHIMHSEIKEEVQQLVKEYSPVQTKEAPVELKIVLKDDVPVAQGPRRLSLAEQLLVEDQVNEWLRNGIVRVSYSEFASPIVIVKKKDGSSRLCIDYRELNKKILKDEYPLPVIEDLIDKLRESKVFSVLDLKNGFFHLKVAEQSVPYTSFVTHHGQFEFLRAPFGLSVSPKYFMRFVSIIFRELIAQGILLIFIDDILIPAKDECEAVQRLRQVLNVAAEYGLHINWKKAKLIQRKIEYLGHVIEEGEIKPSADKTDAVLRYPKPRNIKQVHSFIGLTSYFRKYIQSYAEIARPLTELLKKDAIFVFEEEQQSAFQTLKEKLANNPVLKIFNPKLPTELHTDASSTALAAILLQKHQDGGLHPVHYMSKKLTEAESKYSSYELEALAVIEGVKKFRHYLFGIHFKIKTDCQAFELTLKKKDLTPKVARWVLLLSEYDYEVEHRPGRQMMHTDALSRNPYIATITNSVHEQLQQAQDQDEKLKAIKVILEKTNYHDYWMQNNILYKGKDKLIVAPQTMEKDIIRRAHNNGHFGKKKMKEIISKDYFINNLEKKIEEVIMSCIPCLLATRKEGKKEGLLNPIDKEGTPLHTLHLDHVGPLTETRKQYNHILTVVDAFTKFVWLFPTRSTSSAEVLNKLRIHQQTFGNPARFVTDRGTAFTSNDFSQYCEEEGIEHVKITTGVPRGNGQVERIHRIIIPMLTKLCLEDNSLWYKHVSKVQRCLNNTYQRSIDTTPFQLFSGTTMKCKEDMHVQEILQQEIAQQYDRDREQIRQDAKLQIFKIQEENKINFDKNRRESSKYKENDLVAIQRTQFGSGLKLKPKFFGPYKVTKVKRNDRYDVEKFYDDTEGPNKTSSSADLMKRWPALESD